MADRRQICRRLSASRIISADSFRLGAKCAYLSTSFTTSAMIASICEAGGSRVERVGDIVAPIISKVCDTIDRAPCHRYGRWPSRWLVTCSSWRSVASKHRRQDSFTPGSAPACSFSKTAKIYGRYIMVLNGPGKAVVPLRQLEVELGCNRAQ